MMIDMDQEPTALRGQQALHFILLILCYAL